MRVARPRIVLLAALAALATLFWAFRPSRRLKPASVPQSSAVVGQLHPRQRVSVPAWLGSLSGIVWSRSSGKPVRSATVWAVRQPSQGFSIENGSVVRGVTDTEGRFRLEGLPTGIFELTAEAGQLRFEQPTIASITLGEHVGELELWLEAVPDSRASDQANAAIGAENSERPAPVESAARFLANNSSAPESAAACTGVLTGVLVDAHGAVVAGARIGVWPDEAPRDGLPDFTEPPQSTEVSDAGGRFEFSKLCARAYSILARHGEGVHRALRRAVAVGSDARLVLAESAVFSCVVTHRGEPVTSYALSVVGPTRRSVQVHAANGQCRQSWLDSGRYSVNISADAGSVSANIDLDPLRSRSFEFELSPWATLRGQLLDAAGEPRKGARIELIFEPLAQPSTRAADAASRVQRATSDELGRFDFQRAPAGRARLWFTAQSTPLFVRDSNAPGFSQLAEPRPWLEIELRPGEALELGALHVGRFAVADAHP